MCENPRADKDRLARVVAFPHTFQPVQVVNALGVERPDPILTAVRLTLLSMADSHSSVAVAPVSIARVYRHVYLTRDGLVDEWDMPLPRVAPVAVAYTTIRRLLRWSGARVVREPQVEAARIEIHEHVKRMDTYLKDSLLQRFDMDIFGRERIH